MSFACSTLVRNLHKMVISKADVSPSSLRYVCLDFETNGLPEKDCKPMQPDQLGQPDQPDQPDQLESVEAEL